MATASRSPILIHSSSPNAALRRHSHTPPSAQPRIEEASSPPLPSPSTLFEPLLRRLKGGSNVQPAPEGVKIGFANVGALWKEKKFEWTENVELGSGAASIDARGNESTVVEEGNHNDGHGKLKQPRKKIGLIGGLTPKQRLPESENAMNLKIDESHEVPEALAQPDIYDVSAELPHVQPIAEEKLGPISTTVDVPQAAASVSVGGGDLKPAKKSRKRVKPTENTEGSAAKKPRKQKVKSEAIILNSDDIGPVDADPLQTKANEDEAVDHRQPAKKASRPKSGSASKAKPKVAKAKGSKKPILEANAGVTHAEDTNINSEGAPEVRSYYFGIASATTGAGRCSSDKTSPTRPGDLVNYQRAQTIDEQIEEQSAQIVQRQRCWTPPIDTKASGSKISRPSTAGSNASNASRTPKIQFGDILKSFGYASSEPASAIHAGRSTSGEAATKRRRIGGADNASPGIEPQKSRKTLESKPRKRASKGKKKAQTITAVATAAFLRVNPDEHQNDTPSALSAAPDLPKEDATSMVAESLVQVPVVKKPRKPRKPRVKIIDATTSGRSSKTNNKPKKTPKSKKKSVKFNEATLAPKLYSPEHAVAQIRRQDFLFGTSSQLAPAESPQFIRDMQVALRESERQLFARPELSSPVMPSSLSAPSPNAKIYTRVPTAPHGTLLSLQQARRDLWCVAARDFEGGLLCNEPMDVNGDEAEITDHTTFTVEDVGSRMGLEMGSEDTKKAEKTLVGLTTSPLVAAVPVAVADPIEEQRAGGTVEEHQEASVDATAPLPPDDDDSWMLLTSDEPDVAFHSAEPEHKDFIPTADCVLPAVSTVTASPTKTRFLPATRPVLRPLDANASPRVHLQRDKPSGFVTARTFSSTAPVHGREASGSPSKASKRRRKIQVASPSPSRTEWLNIDEISDSDAPMTPSPPRRRSPSAVQPLVLSPSGSQTAEQLAFLATGSTTIKHDSPNWTDVREALYRRITDTIKSSKEQVAPENLSWWEKILMYDPIVVEDLTAWLNDRGLRVQARKKAKSKRGRSKTDGQDDKEVETEWQIVEEPLQPWMVQKWCEERSICCYLKNGSWRGGRAKG